MKFGKLENVEGVDFSMPTDHRGNEQIFDNLNSQSGNKTLYIGTTSWGNKEWKGNLYPEKAKATEFLNHYGIQFNTIELNSTHYRIPKNETLEKWESSVPDNFKFCPKVLQTISHSRDLGMSTDRMNLFLDGISLLKENLGPSFLQLPPYFKMDRLDLLKRYLESLPEDYDLAIEFRHIDMFDSQNFEAIRECLLDSNKTAVITDVAGRRDVLHLCLLSDYVMIRFVANGHPSDYSRLDDWIVKLNEWFKKGLKHAYFFIHSPTPVLTPKISLYLSKGVNQLIGYEMSRYPTYLFNNRTGGTQDGKQLSLYT